jgi:DNA-directed RNA polymerase subunit RPC12/RpoP
MSNEEPDTSGMDFPCENCGAKLHYNAGSRAMACPYCKTEQQVPMEGSSAAAGGGREISLEEGMQMAAKGYGTPVSLVQCNECGASVNVPEGEQTTKCPFCASHQVLPLESAGTAIRPESMVPFLIDKSKANKHFEEWLSGLWFRPNDLKKMAKLQEMGGVYIPFWTFDSWVRSRWEADAGYHYYETESYTDQNGEQQTREVQRTRWEHAEGKRKDFIDDELVCASKGLPENLVSNFQTFDTKKLSPYQPHYLAGWRAESYVIDLLPAWEKAQISIAHKQQARCSGDVPGDTQRNLNVENKYSQTTFKHVLLPIWIAAYRYQGKPYQFLVNGQTGEVVGKAPWSIWKIVLFILLILSILVVGALVFGGGGDGGGKRSSTSSSRKNVPTKTSTPPAKKSSKKGR